MAIQFPKRPSLVGYVTCGDPNLETTRDVIFAAADAGVDVIELGVPFSDPVADGPVIQRASERALSSGTTLTKVLKLAREIRRQSKVGLVVFSYLNPVLRYGWERFCAEAEQAGVDGALITDLPAEESQEYVRLMRRHNLATVFLAAPTSTDVR
ncbi:MAG: tryptophan synthase subunit alpha, partial [Candidatus Korobacteraceae bacterium]